MLDESQPTLGPLIRAFKAKDDTFVEEFVKSYVPRLVPYFIRRGVERSEAQDLTMAVIEKALRRVARNKRLRKKRGGMVPLGDVGQNTFFFGIAKNALHAFLRSRKHRPESFGELLDEESFVQSPGETITTISDTVAAAVGKALEDLKPIYLEVIRLKIFAGMTHKAIAKKLKISESNSKVRLKRALGRLRKRLKSNAHIKSWLNSKKAMRNTLQKD
jgi:RNA polymerase sigma factor (sigma-70 family)